MSKSGQNSNPYKIFSAGEKPPAPGPYLCKMSSGSYLVIEWEEDFFEGHWRKLRGEEIIAFMHIPQGLKNA